MISAPSMNGAGSAHAHHAHSLLQQRTAPGRPTSGTLHHHHAMENEHLCMDSQKFLIPSLPVSLRSGVLSHDASGGKRGRERSILNGALVPHDPNNNSGYSRSSVTLDRVRRPVPFPYINGPSQNPGQNQGHHLKSNSQVMSGSPRKVERIPSYSSSGKSNGLTNGGGTSIANINGDRSHHSYTHSHPSQYPHHQMPSNPTNFRSSMPIPCSSPAPASSASPKALSPSTHHHNGTSGGSAGPSPYSPQLPSNGLYPGAYPHHPSMGLSPSHTAALYAAAAAAAASHPMSYPIFGSAFPALSHAAATASSYLDNFHSNIISQQQHQHKVAAASPSPPKMTPSGLYYPQHHVNGGMHYGPPPTSPHRREAAAESERYNGNAHLHGLSRHRHPSGDGHMSGHYPAYPVCSGLSKGGPLGMGHIDLSGGFTVPSPPMPGKKAQPSVRESPKPVYSMNSSGGGTMTKNKVSWSGRPHSPSSSYISPSLMMTARQNTKESSNSVPKSGGPPAAHGGREWESSLLKQRSRSPDSPGPNSAMVQRILNTNIFTCSNPAHPSNPPRPVYNNGHAHHGNGNGIYEYDSRDKALDLNTKTKTTAIHLHSPFLPPSPKKTTSSQFWDFRNTSISNSNSGSGAVARKPGMESRSSIPVSTSSVDYAKYLNQYPKPSNVSSPSVSVTTASCSTAQIPIIQNAHASSPDVHAQSSPNNIPTSRYSTFPSRFTFTPPERGSLSAVPESEDKLPAPAVVITPVSKQMMPELLFFKRGSRIELASGNKLSVEDLSEEDFVQSAEIDGGVKILRCTLMSIEGQDLIGVGQNSLCKLILRVESRENQEISIQATPEQPFFVEGRGWSSLSPIASQIILQLNCFHLQVGDVCMTLTRANPSPGISPPSLSTSPTLNAIRIRSLAELQGNVSPRIKSPKSVSILSSSKPSSSTILRSVFKGSRPKPVGSPTSLLKPSLSRVTGRPSKLTLALASLEMLPPPLPITTKESGTSCTTSSVTAITTAASTSLLSAILTGDPEQRSQGPQSPKKRRWSAPLPETQHEDEQLPSPKKVASEEKTPV